MAVADRFVPKEPQDLPSDIKLDVPYIEQTDNYCGPSSLAMVANYYGKNITAEEISNLVYTPNKKGSLQIEMQAAARSLDMVAIPWKWILPLYAQKLMQKDPSSYYRILHLIFTQFGIILWLQEETPITNIYYCIVDVIILSFLMDNF